MNPFFDDMPKKKVVSDKDDDSLEVSTDSEENVKVNKKEYNIRITAYGVEQREERVISIRYCRESLNLTCSITARKKSLKRKAERKLYAIVCVT